MRRQVRSSHGTHQWRLSRVNVRLGDGHARHSDHGQRTRERARLGHDWGVERGVSFVVGGPDGPAGAEHLLFLFELHRAHPPDRLFTFDAFLFTCLKNLLVLDAELAALDVEPVEGSNDGIGVCGHTEICKSEAAELSHRIEVVVKGIGGRNRE